MRQRGRDQGEARETRVVVPLADRVGAVIRLAAALLAPVIVVLAVALGLPQLDPAREGLAVSNVTDELADPGPGAALLRPERPGQGRDPVSRDTRRVLDTARATSSTAVSAVADTAELGVSIDALSPSVVPDKGVVTISGRVSNPTSDTWSGLNVYLCTSSHPMTTSDEIQLSVESDPELPVCSRTATYVTIDELAPGESAPYTVRAPRAELGISGQPGVYWFNIQVLGTNSDGRDGVSDGRARSFLSLLAAKPAPTPVPTTVVVPFRRATLHEADGSLSGEEEWATDLAPGGRLANLLSFVEGAGAAPVTLLVDPAILDAVAQVAAGNPPRLLGDTTPEDDEGDGDGDAGDEGAEPEQPTSDDLDDADRERAAAWLTRFRAVAGLHTVLGLPYGDQDLAAAARHDASLHETAREQSADAFDAHGVAATPAVVPPSGLLSDAALSLAGTDATILLSDAALPEEYADDPLPPAAVEFAGRSVGIYDDGVPSGGPGPNERRDPVALRQRILADAVVRSLSGDPRPLVVNLPADFDPGVASAQFFPGLDRPFVVLGADPIPAGTDLPEVEQLTYPQRQAERELPSTSFAAARGLARAGGVLDGLLPQNDTVGTVATREALSTTSYAVRDDPYTAAASALAGTRWLDTRLQAVTITAPEFVILASDNGPFAVTVRNGLDQPIRIRILAHSSDQLVIKAPALIELGPGARQTVNLSAQARSIGVHPVRLVATDEEGRALGASEETSVRSNQVGRIIWVVMGTGVGILFLAIAVRLTRRIRQHRQTQKASTA